MPAPGEPADGTDRQAQEVRLPSPYELGQEFFRWEFGDAVAGSILGINPFDQPDVQAAKDRTNEVLAARRRRARARGVGRGAARRADAGDYVCIQAFVAPNAAARTRLAPLADRAREATGCVVTHGFGPRYLHSTGQLHKGGPNTGVFLQVVEDYGDELQIPGQPFGFAQPDPRPGGRRLRVPRERGRRVARVQMEERLMQLGMIGLGRMGGNMTSGSRRRGHEVKTYDPRRRVDGVVARGAARPARPRRARSG